MSDWVVGVDLGGTKIEMGLIDPQNRIVEHYKMPTQQEQGPQSVVTRIVNCVKEFEAKMPDNLPIAALGICCPGPLDHKTGVLINPTNLPKFFNVPLRQMLVDQLNIPVSMDHDAKSAGLGEFYYGAGRDVDSMVYTVIGTGVGSAIIIDGQLYRGVRNFAGEVGHMTLDPDGELCPCGSRGCLDTYISGPWLARRFQRAVESAGPSYSPTTTGPVTGETVFRLARQDDPLASQIVTQAGEAIGIAVASLAMILDIELYVFGGSVSKSGDLLFEPARKTVPKYCFKTVGPRIRITTSELGDDAPLLGCGWQARQALSDTLKENVK